MKTVVITTGGLGTRLLTCTKNNPKTMLPLYVHSKDKFASPLLRPLIETIFENLYDLGFRKFCFIVGKKTRSSILNHMLPDSTYINLLKKRGVPEDIRFIRNLTRLYEKMKNSKIAWISQSTPMGFGHALLSASKFVGSDTFLLHAGDAYFPNYDFLAEFMKKNPNKRNTPTTIFFQHKNLVKGYGIAQIKKQNNENIVFHVEEKPKKPSSKLVILPVYVFKPNIFEALKWTSRGHNKELQVTDAIQSLIQWGDKVLGFNFGNRHWFDIGTPQNYFKAMTYSYKKSIS